MNKKSLCHTLSKYSCITNPESAATKVEEALEEHGYNLDHLISCFVYNRKDGIEISVLTSPSLDLKIKITE